jgi:hypothetical protein
MGEAHPIMSLHGHIHVKVGCTWWGAWALQQLCEALQCR